MIYIQPGFQKILTAMKVTVLWCPSVSTAFYLSAPDVNLCTCLSYKNISQRLFQVLLRSWFFFPNLTIRLLMRNWMPTNYGDYPHFLDPSAVLPDILPGFPWVFLHQRASEAHCVQERDDCTFWIHLLQLWKNHRPNAICLIFFLLVSIHSNTIEVFLL